MKGRAEVLYSQLRAAKASGDPRRFAALLADEVVLHTPRFFKPARGHAHFLAIISGILQLVPDFEWTRAWFGERDLVLEFRGHVRGGRTVVHGIDVFEFDDSGRIHSLTVFLRPMSALQEIAEGEDHLVRELLTAASTSAPGTD
jgi:hypothetical protein